MKKKHQPRRPTGPARNAPALAEQLTALWTQGRLADAEKLCRTVLAAAPDNFDALHFLGLIALRTGRLELAAQMLESAVAVQPNHAQAHANLGTAYMLLQRLADAVGAYDRAIAFDPKFIAVHNNRGTLLQRLGRHVEAADSFEQLLSPATPFDFALGSFFFARRCAADWRDYARHCAALRAAVLAGAKRDRPFSYLSVSDSGAEQLQCARTHIAHRGFGSAPAPWRAEPYRHDRLRVAYLSADFRDHVVIRHAVTLFEQHDASRFETVGVALSRGDDSVIAQRARAAVGYFIDASAMSDSDVARRLRELEVDIAVDLTAHTEGDRPGVLAQRPAPVQVNFFGYPGTSGAAYVDYIIGDDFVVPESHERFYSERIVRLPDTFQLNGSRTIQRPLPAVSRSDAGLPDDAMVYCGLNSSYKLNPTCYDWWMSILAAVPGSVLWVLAEEEHAKEHLQREAVARGVDAARIIFGGRVTIAEHFARLRLADLFLDTVPFNAGITASDALWCGVPVLTCPGEAFAARAAGSVLRAIGLQDLIAANPADYVRLGCEIGQDPARLGEIKARLSRNRETLPLFDSARFCRNLESAYAQMHRIALAGEAPRSFSVHSGETRLSDIVCET